MSSRSVLLLTPDLSDNSTGRAEVLWTLAESLGWRCRVVAPTGDELWYPVRGSAFARDCAVVADDGLVAELAARSDLVIAVKPLPGSFGRALEVAGSTPVLLDIDDPDLESILGVGQPIRALAKAVLRRRRVRAARRLRRRVGEHPVIVSNPVLQRRYGGEVVPHARLDTGPGAEAASTSPTVVFVGTNRRHKGLGVLRRAVADAGLRLAITDDPPRDRLPHEDWVGPTTLDEGRELVRRGDIVVIPSMPGEVHSTAQLPAKLIDAMIAGRAIAVADFEPLRWALGDTGRVFAPGDPRALTAVLDELRDPALRRELGDAARRRALELFTVDAVRPVF
ncbi:glycosyltransferase family 4 protein, partial [Schumannella luteola]